MSVRTSYISAVGALVIALGLIATLSKGVAAPISVGLVGKSDGERGLIAILVVGGLGAGDSVSVSWSSGKWGSGLEETTFVCTTGKLQAFRRAFRIADGVGEVCATGSVCRRGVCEEKDACLEVVADSLSKSGWIRTGHVVRSELVEHGVRYRVDGGVRVPIVRTERILGAQIRTLGERAAIAAGDPESPAEGEGRLVEAIVCVDSAGVVTRVTPFDDLPPEALETVRRAAARMKFKPGRLKGRAVADWVRVSLRVVP